MWRGEAVPATASTTASLAILSDYANRRSVLSTSKRRRQCCIRPLLILVYWLVRSQMSNLVPQLRRLFSQERLTRINVAMQYDPFIRNHFGNLALSGSVGELDGSIVSADSGA